MAEEVLLESVGHAPEEIDCPEPARHHTTVGASQRCTITIKGGERMGMTVSLSEPREGTNDKLTFEVQVDNEPS